MMLEENAIELLDCCINRQLSLETMSRDDMNVDGFILMGVGVLNSAAEIKDYGSQEDAPSAAVINDGLNEADSPSSAVVKAGWDEEDAPSAAAADDDVWGSNGTPSYEDAAVTNSDADAATAALASLSITNDIDDEDERQFTSLETNMCSGWNWLHIMYLSLFSTVGVTLRAFMGRFFGGDCESNAQGHPINDFLWPLSHKICVTASGETQQYGGALFIDLPANMFGSFIMGLMTGFSVDWPAVPCLAHDHPLQEMSGLHLGIKTALCGTLTTFSSWNSQMVLMMEGSANPYLGNQVLAAIFGYILGLQAALGSFRAGRIAAAWFQLRKNPHIFNSDVSKKELRLRRHHIYLSWITPVAVCILVGTLVLLYILGDVYWGIPYYRQLWIACCSAPIGTILRWKLGTLNGKISVRGLFWFPAGTFLANFLGSILSAGLTAWAIIESNDKGAERWEIPAIKAMSLGVAGSLSTVSTFVKECTEISAESENKSPFDKKVFLYSHGTIIICCFVGLAVYTPIVRFAAYV